MCRQTVKADVLVDKDDVIFMSEDDYQGKK